MRSKILFSGVATCLALAGCGNGGTGAQTGGAIGEGGMVGSGGAVGTGGAQSTGGTTGNGGSVGTGGRTGTGGQTGAGGETGTGGRTRTGGRTGSGGTSAATGGAMGTGGSSATDGGVAIDGGSTVNCAATMPTSGGQTKTGKSVGGTINGLNYGIWTNGDGGSITVFSGINAFSSSWAESKDFLAHLGLDFRPAKAYTAYGTILANYVEKKSGTAGPFSMIGIYGWTNSPCVEWYINEDAWNGLGGSGSVTATIDGGTYYLKTLQTTGTGGANACESGHTGPWTQMISTRKGARQCGTVTVSDHFKAWEAQGWVMGNLTSVHINVEVGGGTGTIDFPVAEVTTTTK